MDIEDVKRELSSDEKVLESAFKLETLYKKHKVKIWGVISALVLYFGGVTIKDAIHKASLATANDAFLTLQKNPTDKSALKVLENKNPSLSKLFLYSQAVKNRDIETMKKLSASSNEVLSDISRYTAGVLAKKPVDSVLYNDMALVEEAYVAMEKGDIKIAKEKLESIDERSSLAVISKFLKHSLIKAN